MIKQYMAVALQPEFQGTYKRADITANIEHMSSLIDAAMFLCAIDLPPEISEVELAGFSLLPSEVVQPGRIALAPVSMECRRYVTLQPGPAP